MDALVDTGSQVSLISQEFFEKFLQPTTGNLLEANDWFQINGANGLEVPYLGLLITDI